MASIDPDVFLRHEVYLERLASGVINRTSDPALKEILGQILEYIGRVGTPKNDTELKQFERVIDTIINNNNFTSDVEQELIEAAMYDMGWLTRQYQDMLLDTPTVTQTNQFIGQQLMEFYGANRTQAFYFSEFTKKYKDDLSDSIYSVMRTGFSRGDTRTDIEKDLRAQLGKDSYNASKAKMLIRTGMTHYTQQGRRAVVARNPNQLRDAIFVAIWDNRTSVICRAHANERYKANDPKLPIPPLHPNCRSTLIYGPAGFKLKGTQIAKGESGKNEAVETDTSHEAWLRDQPRWFIEQSLGKKRAQLFIDQKYSIKRFVDMTTARPLTLEQLEAEE